MASSWKNKVIRNFERYAPQYDDHADIQKQISSMNISTKDPAAMHTQERINEIATILADALLRASEGQLNQQKVRGFSGLQAGLKHSCDTQKRAVSENEESHA